MSIQTNHVIQARCPDIVVKDKKLNHMWLIDIAVPGDRRVIVYGPYTDIVHFRRQIMEIKFETVKW